MPRWRSRLPGRRWSRGSRSPSRASRSMSRSAIPVRDVRCAGAGGLRDEQAHARLGGCRRQRRGGRRVADQRVSVRSGGGGAAAGRRVLQGPVREPGRGLRAARGRPRRAGDPGRRARGGTRRVGQAARRGRDAGGEAHRRGRATRSTWRRRARARWPRPGWRRRGSAALRGSASTGVTDACDGSARSAATGRGEREGGDRRRRRDGRRLGGSAQEPSAAIRRRARISPSPTAGPAAGWALPGTSDRCRSTDSPEAVQLGPAGRAWVLYEAFEPGDFGDRAGYRRVYVTERRP